ncbi:ABC transporter, ATP-binding protein [Marvinbryantia formatexigens DSM 14469]|uniref:ABC transporter, ATP-binding protein n=2 Tax=Lachnospiraceae TaxID=186803 RepID=C6LL39_9FIRM|nr:ABC transporter, ATP-binding protein [Marvinbryantia formatexigens DSM 14469]
MIYGAEQEFYLASAPFLRYTQTYLWNAQQSGIMGRGMEEHMEPIIKIEHLEKEFKLKEMDVHALRDVSLDIYKGDIYGIIGMSGAGKSTLVRCLNFLERPTAGTVTVNGKDLAKLSEKELREARKDIGMIFQHFNLLMQRSVIDNVCFPLEIAGMSRAQARKKAMEYLEIVGLAEKAKAYPVQLSGGQKQRVAIARVLASDPKILLCDEATSALDPQTTKSILQLLKEINQKYGITIVVITHEMAVVQEICTHVAIIDQGNLAEHGTVEEIFLAPKSREAKRLIYQGYEKVAEMKGKRCVRIVFSENSSFEPVIGNMVLAFKSPVNILYANTRDLDGVAKGEMVLQLPEDEELGRKMIAYLKSARLTVEELEGYVD